MSVSYDQMTRSEASRLLMFQNEAEAADFISTNFPHWDTSGDRVKFGQEGGKMDVEGEGGRALGGKYKMDVPRLIANNLAYAIELERIV